MNTGRTIPADCEAITPEMLSLVDLTQPEIDHVVPMVAGGARNIQDIYPLSFLQEGMLFHHMSSERDSYILYLLLEFQSKEFVDRFVAALQAVVNRHDVLRTSIHWQNVSRPVQIVWRRAVLPVTYLVPSDEDAVDQLRRLMKPGLEKTNLSRAPLSALSVIPGKPGDRWHALLSVHHLICDHQSLRVLFEEALSHVAGNGHLLPAAVPYRLHIQRVLETYSPKAMEEFFKDKLGEIDESTAPFRILDVHGDGSQTDELHAELDLSLSSRVRHAARTRGVTPARFFHAAWALVVAATSGRDDVVFGTVLLSAAQRSANAQRMLGMSVNTLPIRLTLRGVSTEQLMVQVNKEVAGLLRFEHAPLPLALRCSGVNSAVPLFTTVLNFRHNPLVEQRDEIHDAVRIVCKGDGLANYPLVVTVDDFADRFEFSIQAVKPIDPHRQIEYIRTAIRSLVVALEEAPETPALMLSVLPDEERLEVTERFNSTEALDLPSKLIHELFEQQVECNPQRLAVKDQNQAVTFEQLNAKANKLAHYLRQRGLRAEQLVGILLERSVNAVVAMLGTLKAGGAYLPLDPSYPAERLAYMIGDAKPRILITQNAPSSSIWKFDVPEVFPVDDLLSSTAECADSNLVPRVLGITPRSLAYVIYTSGSTGRPKGVMNEHRGMVNRIIAQEVFERFANGDIACQKTSLSYVDSVFETFGPLCSGVPVVILPQAAVTDGGAMAAMIGREGITRLLTVPSLARAMLEDANLAINLSGLRSWTLSGEEVYEDLLLALQTRLPGCEFIIQYGSSEVSSDAAIYKCRNFARGRVPLGPPLPNVRVYVLNMHGEPAPIGATGEIFVGGVGVGRGYLNRPDLTASRFLPDKFSPDRSDRLYRTGDLGCWRADGQLEYLGRADFQVKIHGIRIETAEIEALLRTNDKIKQAVVISRESASRDAYLAAYVVPRRAGDISVDALRAQLSSILPAIMIPAAFCILEALPLTPNGKLNRRALPEPRPEQEIDGRYAAPEGAVEQSLARILEDLLQLPRISRSDNFFQMGLDSLMAMRLIYMVAARLSIQLSIKTVLRNPTIMLLASAMEPMLPPGNATERTGEQEIDEYLV